MDAAATSDMTMRVLRHGTGHAAMHSYAVAYAWWLVTDNAAHPYLYMRVMWDGSPGEIVCPVLKDVRGALTVTRVGSRWAAAAPPGHPASHVHLIHLLGFLCHVEREDPELGLRVADVLPALYDLWQTLDFHTVADTCIAALLA